MSDGLSNWFGALSSALWGTALPKALLALVDALRNELGRAEDDSLIKCELVLEPVAVADSGSGTEAAKSMSKPISGLEDELGSPSMSLLFFLSKL